MINTQCILMIVLWFFDNLGTYSSVLLYRKLHPEANAFLLEKNYLVRSLWNKFGLLWGGMLAMIVTLTIMLTVTWAIKDTNYFYMLVGAFSIVIYIHLTNLLEMIKVYRNRKQ